MTFINELRIKCLESICKPDKMFEGVMRPLVNNKVGDASSPVKNRDMFLPQTFQKSFKLFRFHL